MRISMMQSLFVKILLIFVILVIIGVGLWKAKVFQKSTPILSSQNINTSQLDNTVGNTSASSIETLRSRQYQGGDIKVEQILPKEDNYTSYIFSYPSDKLKAIVLWAPTSANVTENANFYSRRHVPSISPNADSKPSLDGSSPSNFLKYIKAPISLHQGLVDTEVNPEWSKELNNALKKERKIVECFEYKGQDHNSRNLGWDKISERTLEFYNRYLKQ